MFFVEYFTTQNKKTIKIYQEFPVKKMKNLKKWRKMKKEKKEKEKNEFEIQMKNLEAQKNTKKKKI